MLKYVFITTLFVILLIVIMSCTSSIDEHLDNVAVAFCNDEPIVIQIWNEEIKMPMVKGKKVSAPKKAAPKSASATKTSTATKTATATKTSTDAYTQGNITVTGGAGKGATSVTIALPGGSLKNNAKKPVKSKGKK